MTQTDIANLALCKIGESLIDNIDDTGDHRARKAKLHYAPTLREVLRAHFWGFAMGVEVVGLNLPSLNVEGGPFTQAGIPFTWPRMYVNEIYNGRPSYWRYAPFTYPGFHTGTLTIIQWTGTEWEAIPGYPTGGTQYRAYSAEDVATPDLVKTWTRQVIAGSSGDVTAVAVVADDNLIGWTNAFTLPSDFIKLRRVITAEGDKIEAFDFRRINGVRCLVAGDYDAIALEYVQFVDDPADYDPLFVNAFATLLASRLARAISGSDKAEADLRGLYESVDLPAARTADGHDSQSNENRPLREFLAGNLLGPRGDFFPEEP